MAGYHIRDIKKGTLGELSKIREELEEAEDAEEQGVNLMVLVELSDMVGAVQAYLEKHCPHIGIDCLISMAEVTKRAFESGHRK